MELTRQPLSRRGFLQVSAATVGAAALAGVLPRSLLAQDVAGFQVVSPNPTPDDQATVLVDDVLTTGSTVNECAKTLRQAGFRQVVVVTVMRG